MCPSHHHTLAATGDPGLAARRMSARRPQQGAPRGLPGGGVGKRSCLLGLRVLAWLWAASGASAQVFNLSLSVDEGLPPDTPVGDIRAGLPAAQQLEGGGFFLSEDAGDSPLLDDFHVHPDTGVIRTARRLDRERRERYSFAAATLRGAVVQVDIRVNDVNDHSPRFPRESLRLDVSELSPPGTAFRLPGAQDPDAGLFSTQGYTLLQAPEDAAGPLFRLRYGSPAPSPSPSPSSEPEPLELVLLRRLDREAEAAHELHIEAWDGGRPPRTGRLRVQLRVLDENDNPPVFERAEYRAAVREDAPPGAEVCRVRATDRDLGANGLVRYGLRVRPPPGPGRGRGSGPGLDGGAPAAPFWVEELSGVVRVQGPLDREAQAWHQLVVEARDAGDPPEVATVRVSVAVLDVNDNAPAIHLLFLTEGGAARVSEGARPGDYVARVSVSDADGDPDSGEEAAGGGGRVSLALEGADGAFALRPGGSPGVSFLCVQGPLDREARDLYALRLVATDAGSPPLSAQETLLLRVADLNDQPPVFSQRHYRASVSEAAAPGSAVLRVSASDADEPGTAHSRLSYALLHLPARCPPAGCAPAFAIDPDSGAISTTRALDRETQDAMELRVVARDLGEPPLSATCLVSISVDDVNDNEPLFLRQVYNASLAEHTPVGHCFLQVNASDADSGLYGFVEYSLYDGFQSSMAPQAFYINPHDGWICVSRDIDREQDPATYDLSVKAKDGGGLSAQAFVRVEVEDVNDNEPVFNPATYVTSISGQSQPGTEVISVLATDRDSGVFGAVTYELLPGDLSSLFDIDSTTGIIYLLSALSHLESTTLVLMVQARDGGGRVSVTSAYVTVHIVHTTLAPAEFERPKYTFSVYEDVPEDSLVGTVKAMEALNSSESLIYSISSGDPLGQFSIHPWLGAIRTRKPLDHDSQPTVTLTVQAQLGGSGACSSAEVNITVLDVNDNAPVFPRTWDEVHVPWGTRPGTALYRVRAEDRDSGHNGRIHYSLASPHPTAFSVDPGLGVLFLTASLGPEEPQKLMLTLRAQDLGLPPRAALLQLTVVLEPQDPRPALIFEDLEYQVEVSEALPLAAQVLRVQAGWLGVPHVHLKPPRYFLEANADAALFTIHPDSGAISLRRQLNYESRQAYRFRAFAGHPEEGTLSPTASTWVSVRILDENDNTPAFWQDELFLHLEEGPLPRGVIATVAAGDRDSGSNGRLSYFLLSGGKSFRMNPTTGELISWVALDREHQGHHQMTVLVTDHGTPPRNATMTVYISVTDVNDNRPSFPQCPPGQELHIQVLEGQPANMLVTTIFAKDIDEGNNAEVVYSLSSGDSCDHFKIDANSGEIRTTTTLASESRPSYRMTVLASDQGVPPLQSQAVVNIQVIPLSRGRAAISQDIRHLALPENMKPGKIMSLLDSPDGLQHRQDKQLHFSLAAGDKDGHFEVDPMTGDVFLSKELNYEMAPHYLFRVVTKDHSKSPPLSSTIFLSVEVEDQNDHTPSFQDEFLVLSVEENVPLGTVVHIFNAKDGDGSVLNSRIQYFIESHHPGVNPFLIHPSSGALATASPLDRELVPTVFLTVTASDQAVNVTDRRLKSLMAKIVILDVNDHSPTFTSFPIIHVKEDAVVGSLVYRLTAEDPDEGRNGKVTYSILSGNEDRTFLLDESSGLLMTACPLDYELKTQHVLVLLAVDDGVPALSSSQTMTVNVLDVNDEAPVCKQHQYEASVKENQSPGEFVARVEAIDRDSGINAKLRFEILPGASFELFQINPDTGVVETATTLDREVQEFFTLRVLVRDGGNPSLSCTATILCSIEDENDHTPEVIVPSHDIVVLENQEPEVVFTVLASDMDAGKNGVLKYQIIGGNADGHFAVDEASGELSTTRALDREQVSRFSLLLLCSDRGDPPRSSALQLQVQVLDDNDHSPWFPMLHYLPSVREDAPVGTVVLVLSALDPDEGLSGQVEYFLLDEASSVFTVDAVTGTLRTSRSLDREARAQHTFRVEARDLSPYGSRSTTVTIHVQVTDVNDNDPCWEQNPLDIFVSPQLPTNHTVAVLRASDADSGPNGTVVFSFAEDQSLFSLDPYTGEIRLQQNLPLEHFPVWLKLNSVDQGTPSRTARGLLVIHLEGEEVGISFSHSLYQGTVAENCEEGTSVVTVNASAPDSVLDNIQYFIFSGNEDGVFSLCSSSGELTVKEPKFLDFEVRKEVQLIILAESRGHRAYSKVVVSIQDVNDNFPRFTQDVYQVSVSEGQLSNAHIIQVLATDLDSSLNGHVEYSILSGNQGASFQMDTLSGVVTTSTALDYELTSSYRLIVQATDKGMPRLSGTSVIKIHVTDINDCTPVFLTSEAVEIAENSLPGAVVARVSVQDADLNPTFTFSFAKDTNPRATFALDQNTGEVVLMQTLDFEATTEYELLVFASDLVHITEGTLVIRVLDVNDNPPAFSQDSYQATVPEGVPVGFSVLSVLAIDLESNENVSYRILPSTQEFMIDPVNGTIFTSSPVLPGNKKSTFRFLVEASDGGVPDLRALALVEIEIQDLNNHAPEFAADTYSLSVSEDTPPGRTLITFSTLDRDWTHENTRVEYSIISGNSQNLFLVEPGSPRPDHPGEQVGHLVLLQSLDREGTATHQLVILAADHGCPPLSSTALVSLEVLDANDNAPQFTSLKYRTHVRESAPLGSPLTVISAEDPDVGPPADILYRIVAGNERGHFHLEGGTGVLYLVKPLDYEETTHFMLTVQASDEDRKHLSFALVSISVLDDNDHAPHFMFLRLNCTVPENVPISSTLCSVNALDFDAGPYGELTYSISSPCPVIPGMPSGHNPFRIDPVTGDIHSEQVLDYEKDRQYCLTIQAKDKGDSTASLELWVDVESVDEFEPVFTQEQYFFNLPEKTKLRQLIGRVEALDADAGVDGVVLYTLAMPSPFFSINRTNGDIYSTAALPLARDQIGKGDLVEMKVIAQSPKPDSRLTSCTVLVNVSFFSEGRYSALSASSFSISLAVSFLVFLLLVFTLVVLILRHKQRDTASSYEEKKPSSLNSSVRTARDASMLKAFQKDCSSEAVPMNSTPEWLSLLSLMEKDIVNLCRHSSSSGRCSVEGETAEDKEIQRINEHPYRKDSGSALSERDSRVPDSGIPRDSDQLSCLSGETDVVVPAEIAEGSHALEEENGVDSCGPAVLTSVLSSQALKKRELKEGLLTDIRKEPVFISGEQEARQTPLSTQRTSHKDLRSSSHWDYLLTWEPKFQPLASVFNDIARLKDEHSQRPGLPKEKSLVLPPPLITAVAQPGIKAVPPRMPARTPGHLETSPILYHLSALPEAMTPNFSPSLSLLTAQTPALTPVLSDGKFLRSHPSGSYLQLKVEDEVQI
ncbi:protocadherin-23 [Erinaceus europaeus]|uniref:Protocadherin-23 n=1 Tax=Erinaceus europaeus TaxID=9365 RepID=A0ABM3WEA5_ERIEU|nr:protocadherin-23 [Erinaceus europaeus]